MGRSLGADTPNLGSAVNPSMAGLRLLAFDLVDPVVERKQRVVGIDEVEVDGAFATGLQCPDALVLEAERWGLLLRFVEAALEQHVRLVLFDLVMRLAAAERRRRVDLVALEGDGMPDQRLEV